jgi:flagellar basal body-associated protein FliL
MTYVTPSEEHTGSDPVHVYWIFAVIFLVVGFILYVFMFIKLSRSKIRNGFMFYAYFPAFLSDLSLIFNFVPRDLNHLSTKKLDTSGWCLFSAFWTVASIFAFNIAMVALAYMTKELVADKLDAKRSKYITIVSTIGGWAVGLVIAAFLLGFKILGNFRDLYCCIPGSLQDASSPQTKGIFPYFFITLFSMIMMIYFYKQAYDIAQEKWQASAAYKRRKASKKGAKTETPQQIAEVLFLSVYTTGVFYVCWFLVSFLGLITAAGVEYPVDLDCIAGSVLKLQPAFNCLVLLRAIYRSEAGATK